MAIHVTTPLVNHETSRYLEGPPKGYCHFVGRVVNHGSGYHRVSSDNAMIDSGYFKWAEVYDGHVVRRVEIGLGRSDDHCEIDVDATNDVRHAAIKFEQVKNWLSDGVQAVRNQQDKILAAKGIKQGCRVRVVKGRKVAKGSELWVVKTGEGQYGPYADLSDHPRGYSERYYRYVSLENLEVIQPEAPEIDWPNNPMTKTSEMRGILMDLVRYSDWRNFSSSRGSGVQAAVTVCFHALADLLLEQGDNENSYVLRQMATQPRDDYGRPINF